MKTRLEPIADGVSLLTLRCVRLHDIPDVGSWLNALDLTMTEALDACCQVLEYGCYSFSNIEHRVTVECTTCEQQQ